MKTKGITFNTPKKMNRKGATFGKALNHLVEQGSHFEHLNVAAPAGMVSTVSPSNLSNAVQNAIDTANANSLMTPVADFRSPVSAALFDILITRATNTIMPATNLPIPVFGVLDQESDWTEIIGQFLPAGITYEVARGADKKSLDFTFSDGVHADVVNVSCNQVPYVNLLAAGLDSVFRMQQLKMQISNVANQLQFSQSVRTFDRSFFGYHKDDQFTPNQFKTDLQNQNDIRTINNLIDIDKQRTILFSMIPVAGTLTISAFVQAYNKGMNVNSLNG